VSHQIGQIYKNRVPFIDNKHSHFRIVPSLIEIAFNLSLSPKD
jgi:hypothetical protein